MEGGVEGRRREARQGWELKGGLEGVCVARRDKTKVRKGCKDRGWLKEGGLEGVKVGR